MIQESRGKRLFDEWRGRPGRDLSALIQCMIGFSRGIMEVAPYLSALEINPLLILAEGEGIVAVDLVAVPKGNGG